MYIQAVEETTGGPTRPPKHGNENTEVATRSGVPEWSVTPSDRGFFLTGVRTEGEGLRPVSHPVLIERETPGDSGTAGPPRGTASQFLSPGAEGALYRPDALGMGGWLQLAVQLQKGSLRAKSR